MRLGNIIAVVLAAVVTAAKAEQTVPIYEDKKTMIESQLQWQKSDKSMFDYVRSGHSVVAMEIIPDGRYFFLQHPGSLVRCGEHSIEGKTYYGCMELVAPHPHNYERTETSTRWVPVGEARRILQERGVTPRPAQ